MVSSLTYDNNIGEQNIILDILKDLAAYLTDENWNMYHAETLEDVEALLQNKPLLDMLLYDVTKRESIDYLRKWRSSYATAKLLLIADEKMSPMEYLRPGIMASSLLLRPWNEKQAQEVLRELVQCLVKERGGTSGQSYVIESREGTISIPYDNIYFFEAREKKIFVCTGKEEFGFYNTIDKLQEELPEQFIRCHRAFIVNSEKIRKIMLSRNIIFLSDDFDVPLSRSYKAVLKQFGK